MDPCRSSDIRELLNDPNVSDLSESDIDENFDEQNEIADLGLEAAVHSSDDEEELGIVNLTDFSSGSDDNYSPHNSELETTDREEAVSTEHQRHRPSQSESSSDDESVPLPRRRANNPVQTGPKWVRVYPPEPEFDPSTNFQVRNAGIKNCPPKNSPPIAYFNLFFTQTIWLLMVRETNAYASKIFQNRRNSGQLKPTSRIKRWTDVTVSEMRKFIAIVINMGLTVRKNIKDYWSTLQCDHIPWYKNTMSCNRFVLLSALFHLNSSEAVPRGQPGYDPWHKVRKFLDSINDSFKMFFTPYQNISIDESMIGMKNRVIFIQYMPKKRHARFGIKKFEICDSETGYILTAVETFFKVEMTRSHKKLY